MVKKLICMILTVAILGSLFVIGASAATVAESKIHIDADFNKPEEYKGTDDWRPEGWTVGPRHGLADTEDLGYYSITDEGYAEVCKGGYVNGGACVAYKFPNLPKDFTLMFDVRYPDAGTTYTGTVYVDCSLNGYKQNVQPSGAIAYIGEDGSSKNLGAGAHAANVWYTYVFRISGDRMSIYRKSENEEEFTLKGENLIMPFRDGNEFYAYSTSPTARLHVDNVKVFTGTIATANNITISEDKTAIKGKIDITSGEVAPDSTKDAIVVMTAYDKKGKVLDMVFETVELKYDNQNSFEINMPINSEFYANLVGGKVELYLWDSFKGLSPETEAYIIDIR